MQVKNEADSFLSDCEILFIAEELVYKLLYKYILVRNDCMHSKYAFEVEHFQVNTLTHSKCHFSELHLAEVQS